MNVMFVWRRDGRTVVTTPPLTGTILDGVTRDSLLTLAAQDSHGEGSAVPGVAIDEMVVEPTSIEQVREGVEDGTLVEMFACGTAAVIAPIGALDDGGQRLQIGDGEPGEVTIALRRQLLDVQHGIAEDRNAWLVPVSALLDAAGVDLSSARSDAFERDDRDHPVTR